MQKAEAQHNQTQNQSVQRRGGNAALESPQSEQIAQFEAMAEASPQADKLAQLAAMMNGSPRMAAQRKAAGIIHNSPYVTAQRQRLDSLAVTMAQQAQGRVKPTMQLKKDPAVYDFGDGESGVTTSTKVIAPKNGPKGLFKYRYGSNYVIDSFNGTNIAEPDAAKGTEYEGLDTPNISVAVSKHDLAADYGDGGLNEDEIKHGGRPKHFRHADKASGIDRTNKYTWHHLQELGKMELIDMNVHGAMWHYGGIAGWEGSLHTSNESDDDPS